MAGGHHREWGQVSAGRIEGGGGVAINFHKMQVKEGRGAEETEQSRPGYGGARRSGAGERKGRKKEKVAPTGGPRVLATQRKRKRRREGGPLRERLSGLLGCWAER
jgi:hypothetical protein